MGGVRLGGRAVVTANYEIPYVRTYDFQTYAQIWMAGDGLPPLQITTQTADYDISPTLSPDGTQIAFSRFNVPNGNYDLAIVSSSGGSVTILDSDNSYDAGVPMWSPDGSLILYLIDPTGAGNNIITTIEPDGTNKTTILNAAGIFRPVWNNDGTRIAYTKTTAGVPATRVMDANGSNDALLRTAAGAGSVIANGIAWANNSDVVCYQYVDGVNSRPYKINDDGTGDTELVTGAGTPDRPAFGHYAWLPDDSEIIVAEGGGAPWRLYSVDPTGGFANVDLGIDISADDGNYPLVYGGRLYMVRDGTPQELISCAYDGTDIVVLDDGTFDGAEGELKMLFSDDSG